MVAVTTTQLCNCSSQALIHNMETERSSVPIKLNFYEHMEDWIVLMGNSLFTLIVFIFWILIQLLNLANYQYCHRVPDLMHHSGVTDEQIVVILD